MTGSLARPRLGANSFADTRRRASTFLAAVAIALAATFFGLAARADGGLPQAIHLKAAQSGAPSGRIEALKDRSGLATPIEESVVRLANARIVMADYPLVRHDFAKALTARFGMPIDAISNDQVDTWLLDSAAYMSTSQANQTVTNTPIPHSAGSVTALRPKDYGRALVFEPAPGVLIDAKGTGSRAPSLHGHSSGLATLGEAIREYAYEHLIHKVFKHAQTGERTVGHYAVIDAGFDVKQPDGSTDPAGIVLRQAHERTTSERVSLQDEATTTRIERTLRRYGITSAGAYQQLYPYDRLNIQGTKDGAVLDFGAFLVMPKFERPAYLFFHGPREGATKPVLFPETDLTAPDPKFRVPADLWGYGVSGKPDSQFDNPNVWSHELAKALRNGTATRRDAERHLHNLLAPVEARLKAEPTPLPVSVARVARVEAEAKPVPAIKPASAAAPAKPMTPAPTPHVAPPPPRLPAAPVPVLQHVGPR